MGCVGDHFKCGCTIFVRPDPHLQSLSIEADHAVSNPYPPTESMTLAEQRAHPTVRQQRKASIATQTSAATWSALAFDPDPHLNSGGCNEGREFLFVPLLDGHVRIPFTLRRARHLQASVSRRTGCPATAAVFASSGPAVSALLACCCAARSLCGEFLGIGVEYETRGVFGAYPDIHFHQWTPTVAGMGPLLE